MSRGVRNMPRAMTCRCLCPVRGCWPGSETATPPTRILTRRIIASSFMDGL